MPTVSRSLGELAVQFGCRLRGDPDVQVSSVATLDGGAASLGFVASPAYRQQLRQTQLAAVLVNESLAADCPVAALVHPNPHATFARIAAVLHPVSAVVPGVHSTAVIHPAAQIDPSSQIDAFVVVETGAVIGPRCRIGAHSVIGANVVVGADNRLLERVTLCAEVVIGNRCLLHPGAVIGSDGFGNARDGAQWVKVPQVGTVRMGDDVEVGANTTIDRGALGDTVIEDGVHLDNLIQIAHNVVIGAHTAIAALTAVAGSSRVGKRCMLGGGVMIFQQASIGDDIVIAGASLVTHSLDKPGMYSSAIPVEEVKLWRRLVGRFKRLDLLVGRVRKLEAADPNAATGQDDDN